MGGNLKMWWRTGQQKMPLVQRDIKRFSPLRDPLPDGLPLMSEERNGRLAKSDQVANCLLLREYADGLPLRHEALVARNRRRLQIVFLAVLLWWIAGWFMLGAF